MSTPPRFDDADRDDLIALVRQRLRLWEARVQRGQAGYWDINHLAQSHAQTASIRRGLLALEQRDRVDQLDSAERVLESALVLESPPDAIASARLANELELLLQALPQARVGTLSNSHAAVLHPPRAESAPPHFWRRWGVADYTSPVAAERHSLTSAITDAPQPPAPAVSVPAAPAAAGPPLAAPSAARPAAPAARRIDIQNPLRLYLLSPDSPDGERLAAHLRTQQFDVDRLDEVDELVELAGALPPQLILIDRAFAPQIDAIGEALKPMRARALQPPKVALISDSDDMLARLAARRAGVDGIIASPRGPEDVGERLYEMFNLGEPTSKVLIVEDDRAQAMFAEGILRNAGMETRIVLDALQVLVALEEFHPDLILMDFHMPVANGIELTALIREKEAFVHTPIVFLTGEVDQEIRFNALDAGGDDFLSKPIRPKHLIASVQGRIRRYRDSQTMARAAMAPVQELAPTGGVVEYTVLLRRLESALSNPLGGVLFVEVDSAARLRERLGLGDFEQLHVEIAAKLRVVSADRMLSRFSDGGFLVLDTSLDAAGLAALSAGLVNALHQQPLTLGEHQVQLAVAVGVVPFGKEFPTTGALLNMVERATHRARTQPSRIEVYRPLDRVEAQKQAELIEDMRLAMAQNRLSLLYQPIVAVAGGEESRYQTLLRLSTSSGSSLTAAQVIPAAERSGFIVEIDRWVLRESLDRIGQSRTKGEPITLFVTQSPYTLAHPGQAEWLREELHHRGLPGESLVLECRLEDALMHAGSLREFFAAASASKIQLCLSQFEPGPDVDALLEQLPLKLIKLSRKYSTGNVSTALRDELRQIIERAHRHDIEVVGHGVEDPQAAATLWMSGVDFVQGNLVQQAGDGLNFDFHQAIL